MKTCLRKWVVAMTLMVGALSVEASVISKDNNTDALNLGSSWVGGVVPGPGDVAQWDGSVTNGYACTLGGPLSWQGMGVAAGSLSNLTVSGSYTLTLGSAGLVLVPDKSLTFNNALELAADQTWSVAANSLIPQGGVNLNGFTLALSGGGTKQFKSLVSGGGRITNQGGAIKFTNAGTAAPDTDITLNAANITFETSTGLATGPRTKSLTLNGGSVNIGSRTAVNSVETNANELVVGPGAVSTVTVTPNTFRSAMFYSGSFARETGSIINFRGTGLGTNTLASLTPNSVNVVFGVAPTLVGGNGGPDSTTNGILVGVLVDATTGGSGMGLATYDADYGLRLLNPLTEFASAIADGQSQLDNVRVVNTSGSGVNTTTLTADSTVNSLSVSETGAGTNTAVVVAGDSPSRVLTLASGCLFVSQAVSTPVASDITILTNLTLNLNGREGVIVRFTTGVSNGTGPAPLSLQCAITNDGGNGVSFGGGGLVYLDGSAVSAYTGPTVSLAGNLRIMKSVSNIGIPGDLVVRGGTVQNTGNQIPDSSDIFLQGGGYSQKGGALNSGTGASETFRHLFMTGGSYSDGASGTSSGITTLSNAVVSGGTWSVTKGHLTTVRGWLNLSGGVINCSPGDSTSGGRLVLGGALVITNTASGAYTCMTLNGSSGTGNPARLSLTNDVTFVGHPANENAVVIAAPAGVKAGQILLSGALTFDIGDGPASADLVLEPIIINNGSTVGGLTKTGAGTLSLMATNAYTGATAVSNGTLAVNGSVVSPVTVSGDAVLTGTGVVNVASGTALTVVTGGIVDPGAADAVGALTVTGDVSFASSSIYRVNVAAANADRLTVSGAVSGGPVAVEVVGDAVTAPVLIMSATSGISASFTTTTSGLVVGKRADGTELWLVKNQGTLIRVQ